MSWGSIIRQVIIRRWLTKRHTSIIPTYHWTYHTIPRTGPWCVFQEIPLPSPRRAAGSHVVETDQMERRASNAALADCCTSFASAAPPLVSSAPTCVGPMSEWMSTNLWRVRHRGGPAAAAWLAGCSAAVRCRANTDPAGSQPFTWVAWVKISVCFTYRVYPFETFDFFCSCIRGHCTESPHPDTHVRVRVRAAGRLCANSNTERCRSNLAKGSRWERDNWRRGGAQRGGRKWDGVGTWGGSSPVDGGDGGY